MPRRAILRQIPLKNKNKVKRQLEEAPVAEEVPVVEEAAPAVEEAAPEQPAGESPQPAKKPARKRSTRGKGRPRASSKS